MGIDYKARAEKWAEKYGIITYKVKGGFMVYHQNYVEDVRVANRYEKRPVTYKRVVNLEEMKTVENILLSRLQKDGWDNV